MQISINLNVSAHFHNTFAQIFLNSPSDNLEISVQQTTDRLARAQVLSYSLEEESERWKQSLIEVEKALKVLVSCFLPLACTPFQ